jgi:uncharacterized damage-inducible protein DinB
MNTQDLHTMLEYHYWARDRVLDALEPLTPEQYNRDLGSSFKSIRETTTHIYAAEWAWHQRWQGQSPTTLLAADQFADLASLRHAWAELEANVRAFVDGTPVDRLIDYTLFSGHSGANAVWQMVQHIVNHASYHRGQITTMLRQIGAKPPKPLDMIAYYRVKQSEARG